MSNEDLDEQNKLLPYPKSAYFIISNEFCERFCFYGIRTVLILYLNRILQLNQHDATAIFHLFVATCYMTPVVGAVISDSWLGKFKTIFYISIVYVIGCIVISLGAIPQNIGAMSGIFLTGLFLMAFGIGGIKPCVSAFGGDQFLPGQEKQREKFFSFFYLSINLGGTISMFLTPILRSDVHCFGQNSCYSLAFGVPALSIIVAFVIFLSGKQTYKMVPPAGNIIGKVVNCCCLALTTKFRTKEEQKDHWLEYASHKYDPQFIKDVKVVLNVLLLFIPVPVFWALYDQQGSRWTLQATRMSQKVNSWLTIKPDHMQVINAILVVILIPIFQYGVYPFCAKFHCLEKSLQRITVGGIITVMAFLCAAFMEMHIEKDFPYLPAQGMSEVILYDNSPCKIQITGTFNGTVNAYEKLSIRDIKYGTLHRWNFHTKNCSEVVKKGSICFMRNDPIQTVLLTIVDKNIKAALLTDMKEPSQVGLAQIRIFYNVNNKTGAFHLVGRKTYFIPHHSNLSYGATDYIKVEPDVYKLYLSNNSFEHAFILKELEFGEAGNYIITIYQDTGSMSKFSVHVHNKVKPATVSILYQLPQYFLITVAEIMFSITGLEFSYSQAPITMKSVLQAAWLLTIACGSLIVLIFAESKLIKKQSLEFFMFAGLMVLDVIIFGILAYFYKYVEPESTEEKEEDQDTSASTSS